MRVVVVGAGIAGLSAAWFVRRARPDAVVTVLEGSPRIGGKIAAAEVGGHRVDVGAESILARRPEALELITALGAADRIVHPAPIGAALWSAGTLHDLPPHVMGIPTDPDGEATRTLLGEPVESRVVPAPDEDVAVGPYVAERLGTAVVDRIVEPLLGGVYAGLTDSLSLQSAAPVIAGLGDDLIAGARARRDASPDGPVFAGLDGGLARLPELLAADLDVRTRHTVRHLERRGPEWIVSAGPVGDVTEFEADAVILAVPAPAAARLLADLAPEAAFDLGGIDYASMAIVTYALDASAIREPLRHTGFLVPAVDGTYIKAATFATAKWPWLAEQVGPDTAVIRCSVGRMGDISLLQAPDAVVAARAFEDLSTVLNIDGVPADSHVQRWGGGLPQYEVGHGARIARIEREVSEISGLAVCGAAYRGIGIPAVIAHAEHAVSAILR